MVSKAGVIVCVGVGMVKAGVMVGVAVGME